MPDLPDLLFTRLRLLLDDSKGLTVVERMEKRGAARKHAKRGRAAAAAPVRGGGTKAMRKRAEGGGGDGAGKLRRTGGGVALARGPTGDGKVFFTDFPAELNYWGTQRAVCHDQWRGLECRKPGCDRDHSATHPQADALWESILGGKHMQKPSATTAPAGGGKMEIGDGGTAGGGGGGGGGGRGFRSGGGFAQSRAGGGGWRGGGRGASGAPGGGRGSN